MSTFAKALHHAEQERRLREGSPWRQVTAAPAPELPRPDEGPVDGVEGHLVSLLYPASLLAEPYRALRHQVEQLHRTSELSVVVAVSSAGVGDGKTTTSINLAGALAQAYDARVLLVDADLRKSSIGRYLALDRGGRGLVDVILDPTLRLDDVVSSRPPFNLDILVAGPLPPAPYEILKSPRLGDLLDEARRRYDYIVLDTAPLVPVPDTRLINKWVDGVLLVVAAHKTPRRLVGEALNLLDQAKLVGLVFNEDDESFAAHYGYPAYGAPAHEDRPSRWHALWHRLRTPARTRMGGHRGSQRGKGPGRV
jgi:non-specific protein-tyrosine kinase